MKPYIIAALDYRNSSAGIRVLHKLCHLLREKGIEAYMSNRVVNPKLNNPTLFNHKEKLRKLILNGAIAVYPEISDNFLYSKCPVQWILNTRLNDSIDLRFTYAELLDKGNKNILFIEDIDFNVFNNRKQYKRKHNLLYIGKGLCDKEQFIKYQGEGFIWINNLYPEKRTTLAELMKSANALYTFDNFSVITAEARLCGCPVVFIPNKNCNEYNKDEHFGNHGVALNDTPEEIAKAKDTLSLFECDYQRVIDLHKNDLSNFVDITQKAADEACLYSGVNL